MNAIRILAPANNRPSLGSGISRAALENLFSNYDDLDSDEDQAAAVLVGWYTGTLSKEEVIEKAQAPTDDGGLVLARCSPTGLLRLLHQLDPSM